MNFHINYTNFTNFISFIIFSFVNSKSVFADIPKNWQISFQDPSTVSMIGIIDIHHAIMFWLVYIFIVVFLLLAIELSTIYVNSNLIFSIEKQKVRFALKECSALEIFWTTAPSIILFYEILPSVHSIGYGEDRFPALITLQIIGHQWYWSYEYSTFSNLIKMNENSVLRAPLSIDATVLDFTKSEVMQNDYIWFRLLDTNTKVYVPVNIAVRLLITSEDVIHCWAVPSFGIKLDAVPGRLNATVLEVKRSGIFYGQCSELCGAGHGFMPIAVEAIHYDGYLVSFYGISDFMLEFVSELIKNNKNKQ